MKVAGRRTATVVALAAGMALAPLTAVSAQAQGGGGTRVEARGACTGGGTWKLKAKPDNGGLEIEFEVDTNVVGQIWATTITDNGVRIYSANRRTVAPSGSFTAAVRSTNRAGTDVIQARATRGSRSCSGSVRL
jgi:hypothetical protein